MLYYNVFFWNVFRNLNYYEYLVWNNIRLENVLVI